MLVDCFFAASFGISLFYDSKYYSYILFLIKNKLLYNIKKNPFLFYEEIDKMSY